MYKMTKENRILIFNFRLLHRNIITNRNLHLWDNKKPINEQKSEKCTFCDNGVETIEHLFYDCTHISKIWDDLFEWIHPNTGLRIVFTRYEVILNAANDDLKIFNLNM